jgi:hypothetical protein
VLPKLACSDIADITKRQIKQEAYNMEILLIEHQTGRQIKI